MLALRVAQANYIEGNSTTTPNLRGRRCNSVETGNGLRLVFDAGNYVQQVHRLQDQSHISAWSQQFQARTSMLKGGKRSHNGSDARRIQLRDIGQIYQQLAGSDLNQLS